MTKASIVERLLEAKQITAEEAVVLLESSIRHVPYQTVPAWPYHHQFYWHYGYPYCVMSCDTPMMN